MKISVVTPSVRPDRLDIVKKGLDKQTFRDFEWLVCSKESYGPCNAWIKDPGKGENDFYSLNKAWNILFKASSGSLIVSIVDSTWIPPFTLQKLWDYYRIDKTVGVTGVGDQYSSPKFTEKYLTWKTERKDGEFKLIHPMDMELRVASLPKKIIEMVGGIDEQYDKYAALSEKELCFRMGRIGCKFFQDSGIEYKFLKHEPRTIEWDRKYKEGLIAIGIHNTETNEGKRLNVGYM